MQTKRVRFILALELNARTGYASQHQEGCARLGAHGQGLAPHINVGLRSHQYLGQQLFTHSVNRHEPGGGATVHRFTDNTLHRGTWIFLGRQACTGLGKGLIGIQTHQLTHRHLIGRQIVCVRAGRLC